MRRIFAKLRTIKPDLAVFAFGLILASVGAYWLYPPIGLLLPGLILMIISLFGGDKGRGYGK